MHVLLNLKHGRVSLPREGPMTNHDDAEKAKRRWERYDVEIRVKVSVSRKSQQVSLSGTAHDISEGGMAMFVVGDLEVGETIEIDFAMPYSQRRVLRGVVRNRDSYQYGVQFLNPTAEDRHDIVRNCRALALLT